MSLPLAPPEFLTVEELAALTRRTPGAIHVERHRGSGVGALGVRVGRRILWRRADLEEWFEQQRRQQQSV